MLQLIYIYIYWQVVACTVCGAKVKEGAMRRHMKGHAAGVGGEAEGVEMGGSGGGAAAAAAAEEVGE